MVVWLSKTIDNSIVQLQLLNASAPDDGIYWCGPVSGNKSHGVNISVTVSGNNLVYFHFDVLLIEIFFDMISMQFIERIMATMLISELYQISKKDKTKHWVKSHTCMDKLQT